MELIGPDAHNSNDLATKLRESLAGAFAEAGLNLVGETASEFDAALLVQLDVEFYFPDVMKAGARLRVEQDGRLLLERVVAASQTRATTFTREVAARFANAISEGKPIASRSGPRPATASAPAFAAERFTVAIFDVEDRNKKLDAKTRAQLAEYLSATAASELGWRVIPRATVKAAIAEEKAKSYDSCVDEACQIELGKALAAEKALVTRILRVGRQCALTATLLDLRTEAVERAASTKVDCVTDALLAGLDVLIRQLGSRAQRKD